MFDAALEISVQYNHNFKLLISVKRNRDDDFSSAAALQREAAQTDRFSMECNLPKLDKDAQQDRCDGHLLCKVSFDSI